MKRRRAATGGQGYLNARDDRRADRRHARYLGQWFAGDWRGPDVAALRAGIDALVSREAIMRGSGPPSKSASTRYGPPLHSPP